MMSLFFIGAIASIFYLMHSTDNRKEEMRKNPNLEEIEGCFFIKQPDGVLTHHPNCPTCRFKDAFEIQPHHYYHD